MGARQVDEETIRRWISENSSPGGSSYLVRVVRDFTNDEIKALPSTPIEILPILCLGGCFSGNFVTAYSNIGSLDDPSGITICYIKGFGPLGYERCADIFGGTGVFKTQLFPSFGNIFIASDIEVVDGAATAQTPDSFQGFDVNAAQSMTVLIDNYTPSYGVNLGNFTGGNAANTLRVTAYYIVVDL